jgi:hypothetical protein
MTISKLINSLFQKGHEEIAGVRADVIEQGAEKERKERKDGKLVDLAHEALASSQASDKADLDGLVRHGWSAVKKEKFKITVRRKVWDVVGNDIRNSNSNIVDEITDRIVDASEIDEYYKNMFDTEKA